MSMVDEQDAFLTDLSYLLQHVKTLGFKRTGGELQRTVEQQEIYVKTGRSKTMNSNHLKRCAVDLNFFKDGKLVYDVAALKPIGDFWESLSPKNSWGGNWSNFRDVPHFERRT